MIGVRRYPLISLFTLVVYCAINVVAAALHHHEMQNGSADADVNVVVVTSAGPLTGTSENDSDDDDDDVCLLCSVLHLTQAPPSCVHVEPFAVATGFTAVVAGLPRPYSLPAVTHSRAPPLI